MATLVTRDVWHVTSVGKLKKYLTSGYILAPVRAWETIDQATRMAGSTGRRVILRIPRRAGEWHQLDGHFGEAVVCNQNIPFPGKIA